MDPITVYELDIAIENAQTRTREALLSVERALARVQRSGDVPHLAELARGVSKAAHQLEQSANDLAAARDERRAYTA